MIFSLHFNECYWGPPAFSTLQPFLQVCIPKCYIVRITTSIIKESPRTVDTQFDMY